MIGRCRLDCLMVYMFNLINVLDITLDDMMDSERVIEGWLKGFAKRNTEFVSWLIKLSDMKQHIHSPILYVIVDECGTMCNRLEVGFTNNLDGYIELLPTKSKFGLPRLSVNVIWHDWHVLSILDSPLLGMPSMMPSMYLFYLSRLLDVFIDKCRGLCKDTTLCDLIEVLSKLEFKVVDTTKPCKELRKAYTSITDNKLFEKYMDFYAVQPSHKWVSLLVRYMYGNGEFRSPVYEHIPYIPHGYSPYVHTDIITEKETSRVEHISVDDLGEIINGAISAVYFYNIVLNEILDVIT